MNIKTKRQTILVPVMALLLSVVFTGQSFGAEKVSDSTITLYVMDALRDDVRVDASDITVGCEKGIVTLSGIVDNVASKKYADLEAKKINGVLSVVNKISVDGTWRWNADIRDAVRRRILNSAVIESEDIKVAFSDGKVTLSGTVNSWSERQEAGLLASEVRGVMEVVNNIMTTWPTKRTDQEIKNDAVAKLERDVYLTGMPITVAVKGGVITLTGSVGSTYQKDRARDALRRISHVKKVKNDLKIEYWRDYSARRMKPQPSDAALKEAVRKELEADSRVNASDISVNVSYGLVTLTGTVYSHKEKQIAEQDAKDVVGVAWVSNKLFARVDKRADWAVRNDVKFNLDTDVTTQGFDIGVKAKDGVVTLSGSVHTWYEKYHAGDVASRVRGVKDVINLIGEDDYHPVTTTWEHSTAQVVKEIKKGLNANWTTNSVSDDIDVSVKNGVATLTGEVRTWSQRLEAADVAYTTEGVWEVKNKLSVEGYDYDWDSYDYYANPYSR